MKKIFLNETVIKSFSSIDFNTDAEKIGNKAVNLMRLQQAKLNIPKAYCISSEIYDDYLINGSVSKEIIDKIISLKADLGGKIAIRSSANIEDTNQLSMAGIFDSYFVFNDNDVEASIRRIYEQSKSRAVIDYFKIHNIDHSILHMGLIIQELIEADYSGVIYTAMPCQDNLVEYYNGFDENLLDGNANGSSFLLSSDGIIKKSKGYDLRPITVEMVSKIHDNIKEIQKHYTYNHALDIEFCIKKNELFILQVRPMTTSIDGYIFEETISDTLLNTKEKLLMLTAQEKEQLGTYTAVFSDANYSELLPKPTEMDIGVYTYIFTGIDGIAGATQKARNEMGYLNGDEAVGIIKNIGGRTYFSISRNAALYYIGFPNNKKEYFSSLVNEYLEKINENPYNGSYPQMGLYLQDPTIDDLKSRYGSCANEYFDIYTDFITNLDILANSFIDEFKVLMTNLINPYISKMKNCDFSSMSNNEVSNYFIDILEHLRTVTCLCFVKSARLGFYYSQKIMLLLKRNLGFKEDEAKKVFSDLTKGLDGSAITEINIKIENACTDAEAFEIAKEKIGHFSTGEMLEIRHDCLKDNEKALKAYVMSIRNSKLYKELFLKQRKERIDIQNQISKSFHSDIEIDKIINNAQTYMALRETIKYIISIEYSLAKDALKELGYRMGLEDDEIYYLYPREIPLYVKYKTKMYHLIDSRKQSFKNYELIDMPSVICEKNIANIDLQKKPDSFVDKLTGNFLASGFAFTGVIINLDEFVDYDDILKKFEIYQNQHTKIILVARQMNLSHDPFIASADGLIIENAGIVAHGAQRARELGKGAISGIKSKLLKTGTVAEFNPAGKYIKIIKSQEEY